MLLISLFILFLAVAINTSLVWYYRRGKLPHYTVQKHALIISVPWLLFVASLVGVGLFPELTHGTSTLNLVCGVVFAVVAAGLFFYVLSILGRGSLINENLFRDTPIVERRIFSIHPNPMYLSYSLGIAAMGLMFGIIDFYIIAAATYILLNFVEARVERP